MQTGMEIMLSPSAPVGTAELDGCSIVLTALLLHVYTHIYIYINSAFVRGVR